MQIVCKLMVSYDPFYLIYLRVRSAILIELCVVHYTDTFDSILIDTLRPFFNATYRYDWQIWILKISSMSSISDFFIQLGKNMQQLGDNNLLEKSREIPLHNFLVGRVDQKS